MIEKTSSLYAKIHAQNGDRWHRYKVRVGGGEISKPLYGRHGRGASRTKRAVQTGD